MPSISSSISLALAAKLKRLFETSPDKFLSFPIGVAYPTSFFTFMDGANSPLSAVDQNRFQVEFAQLTNRQPTDSALFPQDSATFLWDEYQQALTDSEFADSTLTPAQTAQLAQAIDFLTDKQTVGGTEVSTPSAAVRTYYEYKTVYDELNRQYLDEKLTVEFAPNDADGQKLREAWKQGGEQAWLDQIRKAEMDWISLGQREAVKKQQLIMADLAAKQSPLAFRQHCLDDLSLAELPNLGANGLLGGYTTFFSPNNIVNPATPWPSLTLTKSELMALATLAPPELAARFGGEQADASIIQLSFEYNKLVVIRPWFDHSFFTARSWKLPDGEVLSDGNVPRSGTLPAYVSSLIVVRNIRVWRFATGTGQPLVIPIISKERLGKFNIRPTYETPPINPKTGEEVMLQANSRAVVAEPVAKPTVRDHRYRQVTYQGSTIQAPVRPPIRRPTKNGPTPPTTPPPTTTPTRPPVNPVTRPPLHTPTPRPQLIEEKFSFDGVVVVAFECARLPKSPNPDLSLTWDPARHDPPAH